ncbi:MAG: ketopantoate reductase family protein [Oscillospiraceae bacterium]
MQEMKVETAALIGLGSIGSALAPGLENALGHGNFRVIASGERYDRLQKSGMLINDKRYDFALAKPQEKPATPADLIILAVKYTGLAQAIEDIQNQVGEHTVIISFLNGVTSEEIIAKAYGWEKLLYGFARISSYRDAKGSHFDIAKGRFYFGEKNNDAQKFSPRVAAVAEVFKKGEIPFVVPANMLREQWFKFMCNVSENQSSAILGIPFGAWRDSEDANFVREAAAREVIAIANRMNIAIGEDDLQAQKESYRSRIPYGNKTSMLQDIEAGRPTEVDMFAKVVMELGQQWGVPTPVNEIFYHSLRVLEQKNTGFIHT